MRSALAAASTLALWASPGLAAYPQDVTLSQLDVYQGSPYSNTEKIELAYRTVARDLGTGLANKPQGGSTLGIDGFDISMGTTLIFVDANAFQGGATSWQRAREGNQGAGAVFVPQLNLRKGLPLSLEAGAHMGWLAFTRQGSIGGYGRVAPLEGQPKLPEVALQVGYTGYVGNDELELGVTDASISIGKTVAFSAMQRSKTRTIHPYGAVGLNWIKATPLLSAARLDDLTIGKMTASKKDTETYSADMRQVILHAGMRIVSGDVGFRLGASVPLNSVPTLDTSVGYVF